MIAIWSEYEGSPLVKILFVGDLHNKSSIVLPQVDSLIKEHGIDKTVLLGDFINDWQTSAKQEANEAAFLADWIAYKTEDEVVPLIGNHDIPYLIPTYDNQRWQIINNRPGFRKAAFFKVNQRWLAADVKNRWKAAFAFKTADGESWICSHAGFTVPWCRSEKLIGGVTDPIPSDFAKKSEKYLNWMLSHGRWSQLDRDGWGRGASGWGSPLWADMKELVQQPVPTVNQIVGHTLVSKIEEHYAGTHHKLFFLDTMSSTFYPKDKREERGDCSLMVLDTETSDWYPVYIDLTGYHGAKLG